MRKYASIVIFLLLLIGILNAEDIAYTNHSVARLSYVKGNTYIQRSSELAYEEGVVNMPLGEGDRIGTTDGLIEIHLGRRTYIRLDSNTKVDFLSLPKKGDDLIQIRLWAGCIYFSIDYLEREKSIEIHSPDVSVYILDAGLYRFDVRPNQETEIFVFHGLVEAAGASGSVLIKKTQRLEAADGHFTSGPTHFYSASDDDFDRWSEYRDSILRKRMARTYLPDELGDFESELHTSGEWTYVSPYGRVWVPGGIGTHWRPYYNGRWIWMPVCGWTWLPYETWGWVTFHFGRWHWNTGLGWYWIPTTTWGPGWVHWYWGHDHCGWAPLSYYGYPGVIINNTYYGRYRNPYHPSHSGALTVVRKNQLQARHISRVAVRKESIQGLGKIKLTKIAPAVNPVRDVLSVEKLKGDKVFLHKNKEANPYKEPKRVKGVPAQKPESGNLDRTNRSLSPFTSSKDTVKTIRKRTGYPSSADISINKIAGETRHRGSKSAVSRFYDYFSKEDSGKSVKNRTSGRSSPDSSSGRVKSRSSSKSKASSIKSSSRTASKKKSPRPKSTSKSKSRSSSSKTKKKN